MGKWDPRLRSRFPAASHIGVCRRQHSNAGAMDAAGVFRAFPGTMAAMSKSSRILSLLALLAWWVTSLTVATAGSPSKVRETPTEFHFVRMVYDDGGNGRRNFGQGWWMQDYD